MKQDDEDWLRILAGETLPHADPATRLEAGLLRAAQLRWPQAVETVPPHDSARVRRLLARARDEGLLPQPFWRRLQFVRQPAFAFAVALCLAAGVGLLWQAHEQDVPVVRAGSDGIVLLHAAQPGRAADGIASELRSVGVEVRRYRRLGREGLDADLPQPPSPAQREVLVRHHVAVPDKGELRLEIAPD